MATVYFITYPDWEGHWHKYYNHAVCSELERQRIEYRKIITDYASPEARTDLEELQRIPSCHDDIWLFSMAQNPAIEMVERNLGRKYGHVHNLSCFLFEPAVLKGYDLLEHKYFSYYDKIFLSSKWSYENAIANYREHTGKYVLTGFPVDFDVYKPYLNLSKQENLVVFNQRFAWDRLPQIEIELAHRLISLGYEVKHLYAPVILSGNRISSDNQLDRLWVIGEKTGMRFVANMTKEQYHLNLAKASVVITTSICDNLPVSLIEAVYLGAVPVAPKAMCFPEFIHSDNLYRPYDLNDIIRIVQQCPNRTHNISQYDKAKVFENYFSSIGL